MEAVAGCYVAFCSCKIDWSEMDQYLCEGERGVDKNGCIVLLGTNWGLGTVPSAPLTTGSGVWAQQM